MAEEPDHDEEAAEPSRRGFIKSLSFVGGGLVAGAGVSKVLLGGSSGPPPRPETVKEIADALVEGNRRFASLASTHPNLGADVRATQAEKQTPFAAVLGCADSRVPPELVFDQGIGDLFVVRVAGNIASDAAAESLAYAVEHLGVELVVILGHESCGAVTATVEAVEADEVPEPYKVLVEAITPAVEKAKGSGKEGSELIAAAVEANARMVATELPRAGDVFKEAVERHKLTVAPAVYSVKTGAVTFLTTIA